MHDNVADLMGNESGARTGVWNIGATDDSTLMVKESEGSFERWIAGWQPREFKLEMLDGRLDQFQGLVGIDAARDKLGMEIGGCDPDWLERFHKPSQAKQISLLLLTET
jgi:hypothetical protein